MGRRVRGGEAVSVRRGGRWREREEEKEKEKEREALAGRGVEGGGGKRMRPVGLHLQVRGMHHG